MKKLFILTLCFLGCLMLTTQLAYSQADDGVCDPATTIDPIVDPGPIVACSDGTGVPMFGPASGSLPDAEYVVEINGVIDVINADGTPMTALMDGDMVCVTAFTYDLMAINDLLNTANGLCPIIDCDGAFGIPGLTQAIADLVNGVNDGMPGLNNLAEALALAGSFGTPITSAAGAIAALDALNVQIGGLLGNICYAASAPVCYTIDDSDPACQAAGPCDGIDLTVAPGAPTVPTESTCEADGMTLSGGALDFAASTCPAGSTLEYSTDGGATYSTTAPAYDQTNAITVTVRCTCDADMAMSSPTAEVTTVPGVCDGGGGGCTVDAGEPSPTTADVCDTDLAAVDVTMVFADPGVPGTPSLNQNYVIVDPTSTPPNDILTVSNTAVLDLTGLAVGDQACVVSVAYTQETLDIVTAFVDAQLGSICVPVVGPCASDFIGPFGTLDLSGFLNGLNGAFEGLGFNFTSGDIALWCMNQEITIPLSAIPGGLFPDLVIDLTTIPGLEPDGFCCDFSTDSYCLTVVECLACDPLVSTITADPAVVSSESSCEADGMTLSGGVIDPPATACPAGSTLEYSTDGGATWSTTLPAYDQTTAVTVDTRCVCDTDATDISMIGTVTTVPGTCGMVVMGCTDMCAPNFDPTATDDDGSCEDYDMTCNTDCTAGDLEVWDTATCACVVDVPTVLGCTDAAADNYDPAANCDDGTCMGGGGGTCSFSVGVSSFTCNDGGTMDDPDDDTADITFVVMSNGASWTSDVAIGGVTAGADGMMLTETGVAAGTVIMVTFTSDDDPDCTFTLNYIVPDCTVQIPTLSQWGLISLALLLMIMGSLKLGFSSVAFKPARKKN